MDFGFTPEQEALRQEVRAFLGGDDVQAILRETGQRPFREELFSWQLHQMLADSGWLAAHWPVEYGGGGKTMIEMGIIAEELHLNVRLARRIGLLHDIGKAISHEVEGPHAAIGYNIALKHGESEEVANGIGCHHQVGMKKGGVGGQQYHFFMIY